MAVSTVGSGKQFTTLQAWYNSKKALTTAQDAECYGNVGSGGLDMSGGWAPPTTRIYAATGQQHNLDLTGTVLSGLVAPIGVDVTFDGIRFSNSGNPITLDTFTALQTLTFKNCVVVDGIQVTTDILPGTLTLNLINTVFGVDIDIHPSDVGGAVTVNSNIYNTYCRQLALSETGATTIHNSSIKNNIMDQCVLYDITNGTKTRSNNLSRDDTADSILGGTSNLINKVLANQVVNVASNWKLLATADARDAGASVAAASPDAIGVIRPRGIAYDIGPNEYALGMIELLMNLQFP